MPCAREFPLSIKKEGKSYAIDNVDMDLEEEDAMIEEIQGIEFVLAQPQFHFSAVEQCFRGQNYLRLGYLQVLILKQIADYERNLELATVD